jgi:hypothetical protein
VRDGHGIGLLADGAGGNGPWPPELARRPLGADGANTTRASVLELADALDFHLELAPNPPAA